MGKRKTSLTIGAADPFLKSNPQPIQQALLSLDLRGPKVNRVNLVSGRGGGKTFGVALLALKVCVAEKGTVGLVTAPTTQMLRDVFLETWNEIVPDTLFRYVKTENIIHMVNGSKILLRSRHSDNPARGRDLARGLNLNWVIDDEAALGFNKEQYLNTDACIRRPGDYRFHVTTTTPRLGNDYYDFCMSEGQVLLDGFSTMENPYLPEEFGEELAKHMSARQAERELYGKWTALEGMIWPDWSAKTEWPDGNVHWHQHDYSAPYYLFFDPGVASSAWIIAQQLEAVDRYSRPVWGYEDYVWIATAEYTPKVDGSATRVLNRIAEEYGVPARIVAGADIDTRSSTDANTIKFYIRQIFGGAVPITSITGKKANKRIQYDRLSYLIHNTANERRICISESFKSHDAASKRGIKELMEQDAWPEDVDRKRHEFLPKDKKLEHIRDALLYGAVFIDPPRFVKAKAIPA